VLTAGDVLSERYRLDEPLAVGGMGVVWRATDLVLRRTVAVKTMLSRFDDEPGFARRFESEARIMASLHHPGLVEVYDYGVSDDGRVYLVMQCVNGEPLSRRLEAGPLGVDETLSILGQTARALEAAHRHGIVHRDVKPANLLVEPDATVRLVDFGIARAPTASATTAHRVVGTALYMAPEQAMARTVTPATDVYALGAVAHHCLTGSPPFAGDNPVQVALCHVQDPPPPLPDAIPEPVRALVATALAKDPADRFATGGELAAAVEAARGGLVTHPATDGNGVPVLLTAPHTRVMDRPAPAFAAGRATANGRASAVSGATAGGATAGGATAGGSAPGAATAAWGPTAPHRRRYATAGALAAAILAALVWLGLRDGDPAAPSEGPPASPTTRPSTTDSSGGGAAPPTTPEPTTTTSTTTRPGSGPPTTSPPEPPAEPTSTPDQTSDPVEPPPSSPPAGPANTPRPAVSP
jgi:eukaryotic-like serine/threonine-protein kinase